jgi:small subunit ribosomal protein S4
MGDIKKQKKKYMTPPHPWLRARIETEKILLKEYGIKNKKELWKMDSQRKRYAQLAKRLIANKTVQGEREKEELIQKLIRIGLITPGAVIDDILSISIKDILERRLQTLVYRKGLARSVGQARQFIVHEHICVKGKKIKSPSYIVRKEEEDVLSFSVYSQLSDEEHPERSKEKKKAEVKNGQKAAA